MIGRWAEGQRKESRAELDLKSSSEETADKKVVVNDPTVDREFATKTSGSNPKTNEKTVIVHTLERCFNGNIDREMNYLVNTIE